MQRLGIAFGAHVNAYTSFDETVYMLDLPDLSEDTLELAFTVMRDFGDGALLAAEEIDKERGVILSEKISRDSVNYRLMEQQFAKLLPDSLITRRFPIGTEEVIKSAPRERFVDLYTRYYTPERMTFIVVGDVDPAEIRGRIEATFASMNNPANAGTNPDLGKIHQPEGLETAVFHDKEVSSTDVSLMLVRPHVEKPDTAATRAERMPLEIAHSIIDRRFERISKEKNSPVAEGSASKRRSSSTSWNSARSASPPRMTAGRKWCPSSRRNSAARMEHGFTESELAEAKSNLLNAYEQEVKQKATRKSEGIATGTRQVHQRPSSVFSAPETDLEIAKREPRRHRCRHLPQGVQDILGRPGLPPDPHHQGKTRECGKRSRRALRRLARHSRRGPRPPAPSRCSTTPTSANPAPSPPARKSPTSASPSCVLSNKVRINLKRTDFEQGKIRLLARIGSGKLTQPKDMPMLDVFATAVFEGGGLGKHSNDDLQQILAGKNVGSIAGASARTRSPSAAPPPPRISPLQCQLMCASITDPGYREEALWQFQKAIPMIYQQLNHTPAGPQQEMEAGCMAATPASASRPLEKLSSYTIDDAKKWLTPELTKGYLELTIVGDFDTDKILPDLLATFGALPARAAAAPLMTEARKVKFPNAPAAKTFTYESKIPQGVAFTLWKTAGIRGNQKEFRRLNLLAEILGDRLREEIREKLGASYSPNAGAAGSDALEGMGYVLSESIGKPEDLELLLNTMRDLADKLATHGATADELDRALKPTLGQLEKSLRDNNYWLSTVMSQCQADPKRLELARTRDADYRSITLKEINALAKKYLAAALPRRRLCSVRSHSNPAGSKLIRQPIRKPRLSRPPLQFQRTHHAAHRPAPIDNLRHQSRSVRSP